MSQDKSKQKNTKENSKLEWIYEKFRGDMAIYAFCPKCNFHYSIGIKDDIRLIYRFCPICGEHLYRSGDTIEITFNKRDVFDLYENSEINLDYIKE